MVVLCGTRARGGGDRRSMPGSGTVARRRGDRFRQRCERSLSRPPAVPVTTRRFPKTPDPSRHRLQSEGDIIRSGAVRLGVPTPAFPVIAKRRRRNPHRWRLLRRGAPRKTRWPGINRQLRTAGMIAPDARLRFRRRLRRICRGQYRAHGRAGRVPYARKARMCVRKSSSNCRRWLHPTAPGLQHHAGIAGPACCASNSARRCDTNHRHAEPRALARNIRNTIIEVIG